MNVLPPGHKPVSTAKHRAGVIGWKQIKIFSDYTLVKEVKHEYIFCLKVEQYECN